MDIFYEIKPQQNEADLDSPLGDFMHDHHGEDDEQADKHESQYQECVGHSISPLILYTQKMGTAYEFPIFQA
jgi:hypothetical protein